MHDFIALFGAQTWEKLTSYFKSFSLDDIQSLLDQYSALGPLPGILLPLAEAFLPFLPLIVFVVANSNAYGIWFGFLFSWIGVSVGSILVFTIARRIGLKYGDRIRRRLPKMESFFSWIERRGFSPIFILSCFPFTPSVLVNLSAGLSKIPFHTFVTATILGKGVMIFILSFLGHDYRALIEHPSRLILAGVVLFLLWLVGKRLENRYLK
ncbi:TVP38/TMEM64 family protein [Cohnella fermenti]|uniref:TVP38/TMEM64 family membrane protein n=1 Tax=Cohnella fermenti TaxID=2565925 RepID=A0A4V3WEW6_9BACL|nr:TVP38/TMEM64 family protein [Cohnella fermenti]THF78003.1 TVP38/TMEM64 family protein [Cohnella fermenti]